MVGHMGKPRLIIFDQGPFLYNQGKLVKNFGGFAAQHNELSKYFSVTIYAPTMKKETDFQNNLSSEIKLKTLYFRKKDTFTDSLLHYRRYRAAIKKTIQRERGNIFLTFLTGRHFLGVIATQELRRAKERFVIRYISDMATSFSKRTNYRAMRKLIGPSFKIFYDWLMQRTIKGALTIYSGNILYPNLPKQYSIISSSISLSDLSFSEHSCMKKKIRLLFVGNLYPDKGLEFLIRAFSLLPQRQRFDLRLIGAPDGLKEVTKLARTLNIQKQVYYKGMLPLKDVFREYKRSDIVIVPSVWDKQPKTAFEPMAFGTPVIATNVGSVSTYVKNRETGILVPPGDAKAIRDAIMLLIEKEKLRKSIIHKAFKQVQTMTVEKQVAHMARLIKKEFQI